MTHRTLALAALLVVTGAPHAAVAATAEAAGAVCDFPLRWSIAELDPAFDLTPEEASDAVRQAGMLWEEAAGRPLLFLESPEGMPIRFVWDGRQAGTLERQEVAERLQERARAIEEANAALVDLREDLDRRRAAHDRRVLDLQARMESHRRTIEYWNGVGGAPAAEFRRLQESGDELDAAQRALNAEGDQINDIVGEINRETERLNREIASLNEARADFTRDFPATVLESAAFRETRRAFAATSREIQIFHFEDRNHLILLLAHEFGHALGLEHSEVPGSLMSEYTLYDPGAGRPRATADDAASLRAHCPGL